MEVRLTITGMGIGIPKTSFGVNLLSYCYIEVRDNPAVKAPTTYVVDKALTIGGDSTTLVAGFSSTDWMKVDEDKINLLTRNNLSGKIFDVEIKGAGVAIVSSEVDVSLKIIDNEGNATTVLEKYSIKATTLQVSSTSVRGKIKFFPSRISEGKISRR